MHAICANLPSHSNCGSVKNAVDVSREKALFSTVYGIITTWHSTFSTIYGIITSNANLQSDSKYTPNIE